MFCEIIEGNRCEIKDVCAQNNKLSNIDLQRQNAPPSPTKNEMVTTFGDIVINDSENIIIGDKIYFNSSVTIKQIVLPDNSVTGESEKPKDIIWQSTTWIVFLVSVSILISLLFFFAKLWLNSINTLKPSINTNHSEFNYSTTKNGLQIVNRLQWIAQPPNGPLMSQSIPVNTVIIGSTEENGCNTTPQCILVVRYLQSYHIDKLNFPDIQHHFLIGGDGKAYVGLEWNTSGYHAVERKNGSVDITFLGKFSEIVPEERQIKAALLLIEDGVQQGKIARNYEILAQCQFLKGNGLGKYLYLNLTTWSHFNNSNKCTF